MHFGILARNLRAKLVIAFLAAAIPLVGTQVAYEFAHYAGSRRAMHDSRRRLARLVAGTLAAFVSDLCDADRVRANALSKVVTLRAGPLRESGQADGFPDWGIHRMVADAARRYYPLRAGHAGGPVVGGVTSRTVGDAAFGVVTPFKSPNGSPRELRTSVSRESLERILPRERWLDRTEVCAFLDSADEPAIMVHGIGVKPFEARRALRTWLAENRRVNNQGGEARVGVTGPAWTVAVCDTRRDPRLWAALDTPHTQWLIVAILFGVTTLYLVGSRIGQRVRRLALAASAIAVGDYRKRVAMRTGDELETLALALNSVGERLVRDRNAMKRQADLLAKMAEAARISSSSLDIRECARAIAKAVCLQLGARDAAVFHKRPSGGELRVIGYCGRRCRASWKLIAKHTVDSGEYLMISEKSSVEGLATEPQAVLVGIPLRRNDAVIGSIVARYEGGIRKNDLKLGSVRADVLQTFGIHAAAAISNADTYSETERVSEALRDSVDHLSSVVLVTDSIAPSLTIEETLDALARTTATLLDVDMCAIYLPDHRGSLVARGSSRDADHLRSLGPLPPGQCETSQAFSARRSVACMDTLKSRYAPTRQRCEQTGVRSIMATPLVVEGDAFGAITVYTKEPHRYAPREVDLLESISHHAAFIVRNASLYTREFSIAETLQRSLVSEIPEECRGLRFASRYIPVADEARIGGDFYEVTPLPNGRVGVVIADVSGKGLAAAMHLAACKFTMKAFMYTHPDDPAAVLSDLNDALNYYFNLSFFVTMFYCVIDPDAETLTYSSAGHLPAVLVSREGKLHSDLASTGTPVGSGYWCNYEAHKTDFGPGDTLLLYTDGVTDVMKRGTPLDIEGLHRLVFEAGSCSASELVDYICKQLADYGDSPRKDDIALLAVAFDGVPLTHTTAVGGSNGHETQLPNQAI